MQTDPTPIPMLGNTPAWHSILTRNGLPMPAVLIDFETYFDGEYGLGKLSTIEYIRDARYEEIGVAVGRVTGPMSDVRPTFFWADGPVPIISLLQKQYGPRLEQCTVIMQNARFDATILRVHYDFTPAHVIDTMQLAAHENARGSHRLKDLCERFGLPPKGETVRFKGLHLATMTAEQRQAMAEYACLDDTLTWGLFARLLPMLSRPEVELLLMRHTLEMFLRPVLHVDHSYGAELVALLAGKVDVLLGRVGLTRSDVSGNKSFSKLLRDALLAAGDDPAKYFKMNKRGDAIPAIAKTDQELVGLQRHSDTRVRDLIAARTGLKSWPNHAGRVQSILDQSAVEGGPLCVPLKYSGAHTHRWSGQEGINLQNLPSRARGEAEILNTMRHVLVAPPGKVLVVVDASQVEARGLSWIAGQEDLNELFRTGAEIYCTYASKMIGGKPLRKACKTDPPAVSKYLSRMRNMGKVQVLGGGYGMGWQRCVDFARDSYDTILTDVEAATLIKSYRDSVPCITRFWADIERAFMYTARYHESCAMARGLRFEYEPLFDQTVMVLPSGNVLRYQSVRVAKDQWGHDRLWMPDPAKKNKGRIDMWGGHLAENMVQAMCRDLLGEVVLKTEARGRPVVLHTHDEIVAVADEADGPSCLADLIEDFRAAPSWAPNIPLDAEGKVAIRYEK